MKVGIFIKKRRTNMTESLSNWLAKTDVDVVKLSQIAKGEILESSSVVTPNQSKGGSKNTMSK